MATDEHTYGFSKTDAGDLVQLIGGGEGEYREGRVRGTGGAISRLFQTSGGGIAAASGSGPYTFATASCAIVGTDGVVSTNTATVTNIVDQAIAGSVVIKATRVGDLWVVDVANCGA